LALQVISFMTATPRRRGRPADGHPSVAIRESLQCAPPRLTFGDATRRPGVARMPQLRAATEPRRPPAGYFSRLIKGADMAFGKLFKREDETREETEASEPGRTPEELEDKLEQGLEETFPASDTPSVTREPTKTKVGAFTV
jgi:hypothetical protein